jgi:hypothetical protein
VEDAEVVEVAAVAHGEEVRRVVGRDALRGRPEAERRHESRPLPASPSSSSPSRRRRASSRPLPASPSSSSPSRRRRASRTSGRCVRSAAGAIDAMPTALLRLKRRFASATVVPSSPAATGVLPKAQDST